MLEEYTRKRGLDLNAIQSSLNGLSKTQGDLMQTTHPVRYQIGLVQYFDFLGIPHSCSRKSN